MARAMRMAKAAGLALALVCGSASAGTDWGQALGTLGSILGGAGPISSPDAGSTPKTQLSEFDQKQADQSAAESQLVSALFSGRVSEEQERDLGRQIAGGLLGAAPLVKDEALQKYVNKVGLWVAMQSERPNLNWRFGVVDTESVNAFAAPGGYVLITKGLYRKIKTEAQLAGVLGHEIAHVNRKHQLKLLRKSNMIAGLSGLLVSRVGGEQSLRSVIGNGAEIMARGLDKDAELEADRDGAVYAARAGYEPYGLAEILEEMGHMGADDSRMALLRKTHPSPEERLSNLSDAVGSRWDDLPEGKELGGRLAPLRD